MRRAKSDRDAQISPISVLPITEAGETHMSTLCRSALIACLTTLLATFAFASQVEAQGFGGFFWSGPYYEPPPRRQRYYAPSRKRHYVPSRERKVVRSERRRFSKSPKRRVALVANEATGALRSITCEKAEAIVAEFGFKQVEVQLCTRKNLEFRAMRDGKPFSIKIKANGELARVQRLR
jgi:hypothetical protein